MQKPAAPPPPAKPFGRMFVRDLVLSARIGVYKHERHALQRIRINLDAMVADTGPIEDAYANVVCYAELVAGVRRVVDAGHNNLIESLAEKLAALCLVDRRVLSVRVQVEKLDVFAEAAAVGVEIERFQAG